MCFFKNTLTLLLTKTNTADESIPTGVSFQAVTLEVDIWRPESFGLEIITLLSISITVSAQYNLGQLRGSFPRVKILTAGFSLIRDAL